MPVSLCEWRIRIGRFFPRTLSDDNMGYTHINHSRTKRNKQKQATSKVSQENDQEKESHESRTIDNVVILVLVILLALTFVLRISEGLMPNLNDTGDSFDTRSGRTSILNSPVWSIQSISASYDNSSFQHSAVGKPSRLNSSFFTINSVPLSCDTTTTPPSDQTIASSSRRDSHGAASCSNSSVFAAAREPVIFGLAMQQEAVSQNSCIAYCVSLTKCQGRCVWQLFISKLHLMTAGDIETNPGPQTDPQTGPHSQGTRSKDVDYRPNIYTDILSDETIMDLSRQVPPEQLHRLGVALGISWNEVECIWVKHLKNTAMAATEILMAWKTKHGAGPDQAEKIKVILDSAGLCTPTAAAATSTPLLGDRGALPISTHFTVADCRRLLAARYRTGLCMVNRTPGLKKRLVNVKDVYTVVTMYKQDAVGNTRGEPHRVVLEGSVNSILTTKINGRLPNRIVIYAAAGKGKTTAVGKIAIDWADRVQESALNDLPILFILRFRDITRDQSFGEAIVKELLRGVEDLTPEYLEKFIRRNPGLCYIIFDGLDEYSGSILAKESECQSNIIDILRNKDMIESRVVVTTRPHLEKDLNQGELANVYAKFEIEGFSSQNVQHFLGDFFADKPSSGLELKAYLDNNDLLNELVTTPLFCLMACTLWNHPDNLLSGIQTQSELFDAILLYLWYQIRDKDKGKYTEAWLTKTKNQLGKIALRGLLDNSNKLLFTDEDFKRHPKTLDNGLALGIISESSTNAMQNPLKPNQTVARKIEYFHKAAQECMAGKYLSQCYTKTNMLSKKLAISKFDKIIEQKAQCIGDYENLLRFAAGSDKQTFLKAISAILSSRYLEESEQLRIIMDLSTEAQDLEGNVSGILNRFIQTESVILTSPTLYTAVGMKALPDVLKNKITSIEIHTPRLTSTMPQRLGDGLQSLPHLQKVTINEPTAVDSLPPFTNIRSLKLLRLPENCIDSICMALPKAQLLEEVEISQRNPSGEEEPHFIFERNNASIDMSLSDAIKILEHLSPALSEQVAYMQIKTPGLKYSLLDRLDDVLKSFSKLQQVIIKDPTSIRCLTFSGFPQEGVDWAWLRSTQNLQINDVCIRRRESSEAEERIHVQGNKATLSHAVNPVTIDVLDYIPPHMQNKITSIEIHTPRLTSTMPQRLGDGLQSLPHLQKVTINEPTAVDSLPRFTNIRSLKLLRLPDNCIDSICMALPKAQLLEEVEISQLNPSGEEEPLFIVERNNASIDMSMSDAIKILEHLSPTLSEQITSIEIQTPRLTSTMPERLGDGLQSLPHLQKVTINEPTAVDSLPHFTNIRSLKLLRLPENCIDSICMAMPKAQLLEEVEISQRNPSGEEEPLFIVEGKQATIDMSRSDAMNILENLSPTLGEKIACIEIKTPRLTSRLPGRLAEGLQSFSNLQQVTITDPTIVTSLPLLTNIQCLKFLGMPHECEEWAWLRSSQYLQDIEVSFKRTESSDKAESIHVKEKEATFSHTVTPVTIDVLVNLPLHMQNEIACIEIKTPRLTSSLPGRLAEGLQSFSNLQQVTITDPIEVTSLPHLTNMQCLKFLGLPRECGEWAWLRSAQNLQEFEVSFKPTQSSEEAESIHVTGEDATFSHTVTPVIIDVLVNLPLHMQNEIYRITIQDAELDEALSLKLCSCLQSLTSLRMIWLYELRIDEESLVRWVEAGRAVSTMQVIRIWECGVAENCRLRTHLRRLAQPGAQGCIWVYVYGEERTAGGWKQFYIPHTH